MEVSKIASARTQWKISFCFFSTLLPHKIYKIQKPIYTHNHNKKYNAKRDILDGLFDIFWSNMQLITIGMKLEEEGIE